MNLTSITDALVKAYVSEPDQGALVIEGAPLSAFTEGALVSTFAELQAIREHLAEVDAKFRDEFVRRMMESKPPRTEIFHPDITIELKATTTDAWVNEPLLCEELTRLAREGKCDPELVDLAIGCETKPVFRHHKTYLKKLRAMGGEVAAAVSAGFRDGEPGPAKLKIEPKGKKKR